MRKSLLITLAILFVATPVYAGFGGVLKEDTAVDVLIGPFIDDTDGKTAETGLTLSQADIKLSKNGQALAQKTDVTQAAHDANGYYNCELDATDTNTPGQLVLIVHESGALPVRIDFQVVDEIVYDSLYAQAATDYLPVDLLQMGGVTQSGTDLKDFADAGYNPATDKVTGVLLTDTCTTNSDMVSAPLNAAETEAEVEDALQAMNLDHLCKIAVDTNWATTVHLDSVIGHIADDGTAATFNRVGDSLEDLRDQGDAAWITATSVTVSDKTGFSLSAAGNTAVIDDFETQSAADPTGFKTNTMEVNGTAQTANDNGADINTLITQVGTAGDGLTAINLPNQTMDITGSITGNLSGSVGSATIVNGLAANVITDAACATDFDTLVNDEVADVLKTDVMSEAAAMAEFPATGTMEDALRLRYMIDRNATETTSSEHRLKNSAGTVILEYDIADNGTTFTRSKARDDN